MLLFQGCQTLPYLWATSYLADTIATVPNRSHTPLTYPSPSIDPSSQPEHEPEEVHLLPERRPNPHVERRQNVDVFTVLDGLETRAPDSNNTMYCIAATYPKVQYLVITCTGAWLAAQAGVLDGKVATTNKSC